MAAIASIDKLQHVALQLREHRAAFRFRKQRGLTVGPVRQQAHELLALLPQAGDQRVALLLEKTGIAVVCIQPLGATTGDLALTRRLLPELVAGVQVQEKNIDTLLGGKRLQKLQPQRCQGIDAEHEEPCGQPRHRPGETPHGLAQ